MADDDDLTEFHGVFFDEVDEHLAAMEALLLAIDVAAPDAEQLNAIFRAAHSIKGGSSVFGFDDSAALTHEMETVFDRVRKGETALSTQTVDAFLAAGDLLKAMFSSRRGVGDAVSATDVDALCVRLRSLMAPHDEATVPHVDAATPIASPMPSSTITIALTFGPLDDRTATDTLDAVLEALRRYGHVDGTTADSSPTADAGRFRRVTIETGETLETIVDALQFFYGPDRMRAEIVASPRAATADVAAVPSASHSAPASPAAVAAAPTLRAVPTTPVEAGPASAVRSTPAHADDAASIRVSTQKVDQLINVVGELVITQAMLSQTASTADAALSERLANGLSQLQRNTRDLQEAAMSMRMMPMSTAFSRFPRLVRDTAARLGKDVELHTSGEGTELDKGLIERIVDPLTHLVRNSLDHGIETADERVAAGKPATGNVTLRARHQGGAIVIEVGDDGRGLARDLILAKARERGMHVHDTMADADVWQLIFEAGFSTAAVVTDVSGRGVGMDVVKRNIQALGGRVEIDSTAGHGTRITIRLPLTLAILDGLSVGVGPEQFIIPLTNIVESLQPAMADLKTLGGRDRVVHVRGEYLPVVALHEVFDIEPSVVDLHRGILVVLESDGRKTALLVDTLIGQHQVVIKSLESNYRRVPGVSGATIMGDGRVALILDANALADMGRPALAAA